MRKTMLLQGLTLSLMNATDEPRGLDWFGIVRKRFAAAAVVAGVAVVLAAISPPSGWAAFPGENGKIAFVRDADIWVMDNDGQNQTNLTNSLDRSDDQPAWSPDGTKIAFSREFQIWVMDAGGRNQRQLTSNGTEPAWSPDGSKIAFRTDDGRGDIFVMDANGANPTNLTNNQSFEFAPAWSPDGTRIAFVRQRGDGLYETYIMDANGANPTKLPNSDFGQAPNWSPDGTKIAFSNGQNVFVVDANGENLRQLTSNPGAEYQPAWSPDGTRIVYIASFTSNTVAVIDADGGNQATLINNTDPNVRLEKPDWQPVSQDSDRDGDGIFDSVDAQPGVPSTRFSDVARGGRTTGDIISVPLDMSVAIRDVLAPDDGVEVVVTGPATGRVRLRLVGKRLTLRLAPGIHIVTDPDAVVTVEVVEGGPAEIELAAGGLVVIGTDGKARIIETDIGDVIVEALVGAITLNGAEVAQGSGVTVTDGTLSNITLFIQPVPRRTTHAFALTATFTRGTGSNGIDPLAEAVAFRIGTYSATIPPGSFRRDRRSGRFQFVGKIDGVPLTAVLTPLPPLAQGRFRVSVAGAGVNLADTVNPVTVGITIGDDGASAETSVLDLPLHR